MATADSLLLGFK
jgi:hypothetical protein